jgi:flagellar basal-body rod protein FlgB
MKIIPWVGSLFFRSSLVVLHKQVLPAAKISVYVYGMFFAIIVALKEAVMRIEGIFSSTIDLLGKSVDLRAKNQNLIASNIANAETPNYVPKTLAFEEELQGAIKSDHAGEHPSSATDARHVALRGPRAFSAVQLVSGRVLETPAKTPSKDGNAVEVENEMGKMAENQIMFNASVQLLTKKFEGLRTAIKGGI